MGMGMGENPQVKIAELVNQICAVEIKNTELRAELADALIIERPEGYEDVHRDILLQDFMDNPRAFSVRWADETKGDGDG